jgi:small subunit ribosomal protein S3
MKSQCENAMNAGAKGVKILCSGRLGGAEIARSETQKLGSIPLQTLDANVDYGTATSRTTYGAIGIKVWIYKGKFGEEIVPTGRPRRPQRPRPRRGGPSSRTGGRADVARSRKSPSASAAKPAPAKPAPAKPAPAKPALAEEPVETKNETKTEES